MSFPRVTQYPQELSFYLNRLQGYSRQIYRLQTLGPDTTTTGGIITVDLPSNALVNLDSLAMWFRAKTGGTNDMANVGGQAGLFSRNIESLIQRIDLSINGVQIQTIDQYNRVFNVMESLSGQSEFRTKRKLPAFGDPAVGDITNTAANYCINNWLGFLNSSQPAIIDTSMVGNIRLTITLDNERCVRHTVAAPAADKVYYLSNLYFTIETLDIQDGIFSELHRKYLESGNVYEIPFTNYFTYTANTANVKFNLSTQSLDAVYGTAFTSTATALANVNNNGETIQASIFTRQAVAAATHQFNVNGTFYPTYRVPSEDVFAWNVQELATAQDLVSQPLLPANTRTNAAWVANMFVFMVRLAHPDSTGRLISGLDTRGSMASCYYETSNLPAGTDGVVIAQTKSMLRVGYGRQLELVM